MHFMLNFKSYNVLAILTNKDRSKDKYKENNQFAVKFKVKFKAC